MREGTKRKYPERTSGCRRSYGEYVNHMIRFFLMSPDGLNVAGHTQADLNNWVAVQAVWADLDQEDQEMLTRLYTSNRRYEDTVLAYAAEHAVSPKSIWKRLADITFKIALMRGLI